MNFPNIQCLTGSADDVAEILGTSTRNFLNRRKKLEADHGFPPKLPGMGRWSMPAVKAWVRSNGVTSTPDSATNTVALATQEMEQRYGH